MPKTWNKRLALGFLPIVIMGLVFGAYLSYAILSYPHSPTVGSVTFSKDWHYVGNVTQSGGQSACVIFEWPCPTK